MTERDTDLDFDFFDDEPEPFEPSEEERQPRRPPPGGPPRRPHARPPVGFTPLLRLAGLIAFAILIIILFVFWISSCQGASKKSSYKHYLDKVSTVAKDSESIGRELNNALTTQGTKFNDLTTKITGLAQREEQDVAAAQQMSPPGPLRLQHQQVIESLQFRVSGLHGLAAAFAQAARTPKNVSGNALNLLLPPAQRLIASDVIWADLFQAPLQGTGGVLQQQGVHGVAVPASKIVSIPDYGSSRFWETILQRLVGGTSTGGTTSGSSSGLHGTGLVSTKAEPGNHLLSPNTENTVTASTDLGFAVTIQDTGDFQEVQVKVTLTIAQSPTPIVQTQTVDLIDPGQQKTVAFNNLGQVQFATKTTVKVDVQPVPHEKNTSNNSAQYPVIFSLG
jgi:CARDB